ncbi:MAG: hypothetical protein QM695_06485 [Micropruina sp.]
MDVEPGSAAGEYRRIEFDALYKEVADNSTRIYAVFSLCVTATTAAIGILMGPLLSADPTIDAADVTPLAVLVLPGMIILPCMLLITGLLHSTVRIAGYIAVFIEQAGGAQWQRRLQTLRKLRRRRYFYGGMTSIFSGLGIVTIGCSVLAAIRRWGPNLTPWMIVYLVTLAALVVLFGFEVRGLRNVWTTERFSDYQQSWQVVKEREDSVAAVVSPGAEADGAAGQVHPPQDEVSRD